MDARTGEAPAIDARTSLGRVRLTVADLARQIDFYEQVLGLSVAERGADVAVMGVDSPLVELVGDPTAPPRPPRTTGLFHLALLVPTRRDLARVLRRLLTSGWGLSGASDHLVSEALYLSDAEGNGIEVYRDRPRDEWPYADGTLQMDTAPLDLRDLLSEAGDDDRPVAMAAGTRLGHIHLNVSDIPASERFYSGVLGFEVTVRGYPGALFVSAGGYHHHIGLNTWSGEGAPPPPAGARGLRSFEIVVADRDELERLYARLERASIGERADGDRGAVRDPSGNALEVIASGREDRAPPT